MLARLVTAHNMLDGLVCREVDSVSRAWIDPMLAHTPPPLSDLANVPAPTITLDMPRQRLRMPSVVAIRYVP